MYRLVVFSSAHPDAPLTLELSAPGEVLEAYRKFARDGADCERIEVHGPGGLLFSTDPRAVTGRQHDDMIL